MESENSSSESRAEVGPQLKLASCTFNDGTKIAFGPNDIVVVVGANNCGKSETLRNIRQGFGKLGFSGTVVRTVEISKDGSPDDAEKFLTSKFRVFGDYIQHAGVGFYAGNLKPLWGTDTNLDSYSHFFCVNQTVENRLLSVTKIPGFDIHRDAPTHPAHKLCGDFKLETKFSNYFREAFGQDLILYPLGNAHCNLHVGTRPKLENGFDGIQKYAGEILRLPLVETQGDGVKCYVALLFQILLEDYLTTLVDEPEAFLHPPQAKLLGKVLSRELPSNRTLIISTHSSDLIKGLLNADKGRVRVLRIQRENDINRITELSNGDVKTLWDHPLMRASNILDGLFHSRVVVCESDGDCRFFGAIYDALYGETSEVMFAHCNGKDRLHVVARALHKVRVPISVVADFDLLNDEANLERVVQSVNGDWGVMKADWKAINQAINQKKAELLTADVKREIATVLDNCTAELFSSKDSDAIKQILKRASPWAHAKGQGIRFLPNGDIRTKCVKLLNHLQSLGIYIVPIGELESFVPTIGSRGSDKSKWLSKAIEKDFVNDLELTNARLFVKSIVEGSPIDQRLLVG